MALIFRDDHFAIIQVMLLCDLGFIKAHVMVFGAVVIRAYNGKSFQTASRRMVWHLEVSDSRFCGVADPMVSMMANLFPASGVFGIICFMMTNQLIGWRTTVPGGKRFPLAEKMGG